MSDARIYNAVVNKALRKYALGDAILGVLFDGDAINSLTVSANISSLDLDSSILVPKYIPVNYDASTNQTTSISMPTLTSDNSNSSSNIDKMFDSMATAIQLETPLASTIALTPTTASGSFLQDGVLAGQAVSTDGTSTNTSTTESSTTDQSTTNVLGASWDVQTAVKYLQEGKFAKHTCAGCVAKAVHKAGLDMMHCSENNGDGWAPSLHYAGILAKHGWTLVDQGTIDGWKDDHHIELKAGDICVLGNSLNDHKNAHACMYDGHLWQSDYHLNHMAAYGTHGKYKFFIYRYTKGAATPTSTQSTAQNESTKSNSIQTGTVKSTNKPTSNLVLPEKLRTIVISKTNHTFDVGGIMHVNCALNRSGYGSGDGGYNSCTTPVGNNFKIVQRKVMGSYDDGDLAKLLNKKGKIHRPHAYGGRMFVLHGMATSGTIDDRGIAIHGSDEWNDPDNYAKDPKLYGTHGCIALKTSDLDRLELIFDANGGFKNFKVIIER